MKRVTVIGIAGGSGSGKSTICDRLVSQVGEANAVRLRHDDYYRDFSHLPSRERARVNYDSPESLESDLLVDHLGQLLDGQAVDVPQYDFATHSRGLEGCRVLPKTVVFVEGILLFAHPGLRDACDIRVFVDASEDVRFARRLDRDVRVRGRTPESVIQQWKQTVQPMHRVHVEPSKRFAHLVVPTHQPNEPAIELLLNWLSGTE